MVTGPPAAAGGFSSAGGGASSAAGGTGSAARAAVEAVVDPEIRVLTIAELGILRAVEVTEATGAVRVTVTPTYSGCPAMELIRGEIRAALHRSGFTDVAVVTELAPAWSTDWITEAGRRKLVAAGIAPPSPATVGPVPVPVTVRCPACGSPRTEQLSRFGATACKALWRCLACTEPFEQMKAF
ncbi:MULTISPECIES: 1,2-phenylacetyl-CoA epoxidase subunit PaaD [unclassified Solwaraspora]|uniref:1,2-phenylacetyl-CoA epoxidase subunit PaaD n=1 Tax=unclassified Solwaraspora TaxID=2627926 RepID=UPI00248BCCA0|nr:MULTISPECIES: 1,2-phenylacetyl-CoA epoxidase subunit PaaD [unclassified Solwaraspora]WBB96597.1 phenylacetate-CoA oxygenase subunit PaaJ [Solwaraspora sp. WMMA2059]WBC19499.1 phenylacetate-CoA oxygenase subunit PaaJ [Solwaraspora sp. WMMA2080]WJK32918.1 1,2-phenylacetyl-CoA epoxidase subunit PaaD [Solwaraspora sp. WMMA2065]